MLGYSENRILGGGGAAQAPITLTTTKQTGFTIRFYCSTYNTITINWGDGNSQLVVSNSNIIYNYAEAGEHTVTITGDSSKITRFYCQNMEVTSVTFNDNCDFSNCKYIYLNNNLYTELFLPSSLQVYSTLAFYSCPKLTVIGADNLISGSDFSANDCPELTTLSISNLSSCGSFSVHNNIKLTALNISNLTTCTGAFRISNTSLSSLKIYFSSCNGFDASYCSDLTTLDLSTLTVCGGNKDMVLNDCPELMALDISNLTICGRFYIQNCQKLEVLNITNLTSINNTFNTSNTGIFSLTVKFTTIDYFYAYSCPNLTVVDADSLETCGRVFDVKLCASLSTVKIDNIINTTSISNFYFNGTALSTLKVYYTISNSTHFFNCPNLTTFEAPNLVTTIQLSGYSSSNLTTVYIPNLTSCTANFYFYYCTNLTVLNMSTLTNAYRIWLYASGLKTVSLSQIQTLHELRFEKNGLLEAEVDAIINQCLSIAANDSSCTFEIDNGVTGGVNNAKPSAAGLADVATLRTIGWTVRHA